MGLRRVKLGCEVIVDSPPAWLRSARLGILSNQASVTSSFEHVIHAVHAAGGNVCCLFSPQHGLFSEKQANMRESDDGWEGELRVPVYSLYGQVRQPGREMLETIDVLLIDLQDVGTRVYTYGTTMGLCIEAAAQAGVKVVVLDRPNPINGAQLEGNVVAEGYRSFVGRYPIPMRHGLTMGELARYINKVCSVSLDLEVIAMEGWGRELFFPQTHLPWIFPSPNMPSWETALLYPGMVLLEGTNVSEGRGTTLPFQLFGAPYIDQKGVMRFLEGSGMDGVHLRPVCFEPTFDKWCGKQCYGFQIHILDPQKLNAYRLGLALLQAIYTVHPEQFEWLPPPYEYEWEKLPIDILIGDRQVRQGLEGGTDVRELEANWQPQLVRYRESIAECLIYS